MRTIVTIIRAELWQRRWSLFWWSISLAAFIVLNLAFYPSFKDQAAELDKALANMPDSLRALFTDSGDFLSPVGFLSSQIYYLMLPLLLGIFCIGLGSSLIGKEEQRGTLELLLARPLSRTTLLISKALAGGAALTLLGLVGLVTAVLGVKFVDLEVGLGRVALATMVSALLALVFGCIAFALSALGRIARTASIGLAALVAIGGYIIASLESTVEWLQWPAKVLPYHYYHPSDILTGATMGEKQILGYLAVSLALYIIAWLGFRRRDIG